MLRRDFFVHFSCFFLIYVTYICSGAVSAPAVPLSAVVDVYEVEEFYSPRTIGKKYERGRNENLTPEEQAKRNLNIARKKLTRRAPIFPGGFPLPLSCSGHQTHSSRYDGACT
mgnify:CR=1 FL=1